MRLVSLSQVAADQERVISRDQLHALGCSHAQIQHEIAVGRWQVAAPSVIAMQNAPLVYRQRLWLGILHASPRGVLSHGTACSVGGLERWDDETVDVLTPKSDLVEELPGFFFHQTRRDYLPWVRPGRRPPRLRIEHAALLASERDDHLRRAVGRLAAVVQQRLTTADRLLAASRDIRKLRHGRLFRLALGDIAGGAHSFAELEIGFLCAVIGLRAPERQVIRYDAQGRRRYLDCEWVLEDGRVVVLEIDGSFHFVVDSWIRDMRREREIALSGRTVLRCSSIELRISPWEVIADLVTAGVPYSDGSAV